MIRKVYEVDPLTGLEFQGQMLIIAFLTIYAGVDKNIILLKLSCVAESPPSSRIASQEALTAVYSSAECLS